MATPLTPDALDDLVQTTLPLFKKNSWTDISLAQQNYCHAEMINTMGVEERGGYQLSFRVQIKTTGNARNTGMYAADITKVEDVMTTGVVPWTKQTVNMSYDIDEEDFQSDEETIIRLLQIRVHDAMNDMAKLHEQNLWTNPSGTTDKRPFGIPHWFKKDASTTPTGDFNGGNPTGFSAGAAGISSTVVTAWQNWTFGYTAVTVPDLVARTKRAIAMTEFEAPHPHPELGYGKSKYKIYTTYDVQEQLERVAESRNDRLGGDVARFMNQVTVGAIPIKWVSYLQNNDSTDPLYGINFQSFRPFVKKGRNMRRFRPQRASNQHSVREVHWDHWMNYACNDRRKNWVGSVA
jgi:hypothetical protein